MNVDLPLQRAEVITLLTVILRNIVLSLYPFLQGVVTGKVVVRQGVSNVPNIPNVPNVLTNPRGAKLSSRIQVRGGIYSLHA